MNSVLNWILLLSRVSTGSNRHSWVSKDVPKGRQGKSRQHRTRQYMAAARLHWRTIRYTKLLNLWFWACRSGWRRHWYHTFCVHSSIGDETVQTKAVSLLVVIHQNPCFNYFKCFALLCPNRAKCPNCNINLGKHLCSPDKLNVKKVDFIWVTREQRSLEWFITMLSKMEIEQRKYIKRMEKETGEPVKMFMESHLYVSFKIFPTLFQ